MLIDTHCHIHDRDTYDFAIRREQDHGNRETAADFTPEKIITRANAAGIKKMVCVGTNHKDSLAARDFAASHSNIFWSYGIHPEEPAAENLALFEEYKRSATRESRRDSRRVTLEESAEFSADRPIAIGEVGLDYHSADYDRNQQIKLLEQMLELADKNNLPLIFHVRTDAAFEDFWPIVDNAHVKRAVVHSFSDSTKNLKQALDHDFYIGINGLATFVNLYPDGLPPLSHILLETDAPFLSPVRGKVNEPAYIKNITKWLSKVTNTDFETIANTTTKNAESLFNLA